ncbi:hypothetical protein NKH77_01760 [Streptomyces sp. M19]
MGRAVIALYTSAAQPVMAELGRDLENAARRPGLALLPTEDHVAGPVEQRRRAAPGRCPGGAPGRAGPLVDDA